MESTSYTVYSSLLITMAAQNSAKYTSKNTTNNIKINNRNGIMSSTTRAVTQTCSYATVTSIQIFLRTFFE